jgi:hypothetical protein
MNSEVAKWLESAPASVKRMFSGSANVIDFWRAERRRNLQMARMHDGSISDESNAFCREQFEICDTIIEVSIRW